MRLFVEIFRRPRQGKHPPRLVRRQLLVTSDWIYHLDSVGGKAAWLKLVSLTEPT